MVDSNPEKSKKEKVLGEKIKKPTDWVGFAVVISAVLIGGFFILQNIGIFNDENKAQEKTEQVKAEYQKNVNDPNNTPEAVYEQARQALLNNDLEGVLETIHPEAMWKYEELKENATKTSMMQAAERMTPLTSKVYAEGEVVVYETEPIPGNEDSELLEGYRETVEFTRDDKGIWKISSI